MRAGQDTAARLGGNGPCLLQVGGERPANAFALAGRVAAALSQSVKIGGRWRASASVGMALLLDDGDEANLLLRRADLVLYAAKRGAAAAATTPPRCRPRPAVAATDTAPAGRGALRIGTPPAGRCLPDDPRGGNMAAE